MTLYFERMSGHGGMSCGPPASMVRCRAWMDSIIWFALKRRDSSCRVVVVVVGRHRSCDRFKDVKRDMSNSSTWPLSSCSD